MSGPVVWLNRRLLDRRLLDPLIGRSPLAAGMSVVLAAWAWGVLLGVASGWWVFATWPLAAWVGLLVGRICGRLESAEGELHRLNQRARHAQMEGMRLVVMPPDEPGRPYAPKAER